MQEDQSSTQEDQLLVLSRQFVEIKVPFADADIKEVMAGEVREKLDETIRLQLVSEMTPEQIDDYSDLLEGESVTDDEILDFIKSCNINVDEVTQVALTKFRIAYLGA